jgi:hypothetical protein
LPDRGQRTHVLWRFCEAGCTLHTLCLEEFDAFVQKNKPSLADSPTFSGPRKTRAALETRRVSIRIAPGATRRLRNRVRHNRKAVESRILTCGLGSRITGHSLIVIAPKFAIDATLSDQVGDQRLKSVARGKLLIFPPCCIVAARPGLRDLTNSVNNSLFVTAKYVNVLIWSVEGAWISIDRVAFLNGVNRND